VCMTCYKMHQRVAHKQPLSEIVHIVTLVGTIVTVNDFFRIALALKEGARVDGEVGLGFRV
jgi:hypothetical protein